MQYFALDKVHISGLLNIFVYSSKYIWKNQKIVQGANSDLPELSSPRLSSASTFFPARPSLSLLPLRREKFMIIGQACKNCTQTIYHIVYSTSISLSLLLLFSGYQHKNIRKIKLFLSILTEKDSENPPLF